MATLRSLAISLLRLDGHPNIAANRHHAREPANPQATSSCKNTTLPYPCCPWQENGG
jgi:hypothetical protein